MPCALPAVSLWQPRLNSCPPAQLPPPPPRRTALQVLPQRKARQRAAPLRAADRHEELPIAPVAALVARVIEPLQQPGLDRRRLQRWRAGAPAEEEAEAAALQVAKELRFDGLAACAPRPYQAVLQFCVPAATCLRLISR